MFEELFPFRKKLYSHLLQLNQTNHTMKLTTFYLFILVLFVVSCTQKNSRIHREIPFNNDWKFIRSDAENAQLPDFDDSSWRILDLPHDYSIEDLPEKEGVKQIGPFSEESAGASSTGHVLGGTAWYRKHFTLDKTDEGNTIQILFDGIYMNSDVWINGHHLGSHPYGYTSFSYDLTDYLNPSGQDNILAVQVKNEGKNSRWYSGSGIYRDVMLIKTAPVHVDLWGVYISTSEVKDGKAFIDLRVKVLNVSNETKDFTIKTQLINPAGEVVAESESEQELGIMGSSIFQTKETVENANLWSTEDPVLYSLLVQIIDDNVILDQYKEKFGIRTIDFSPEKGFLLNGENVLLKGACMHHDNGPLGSAAFKSAEYRRVKIMKENGFNAIRTSHNPPSKAFLDACDELGMLVMDESFDQWQRPKNPEDYNLYFDDWWEKDLESMVMRDRNHPSIIIWSIGNEINERADSSGLEIARLLKNKIVSLDDTRPITQAICHFWDHPGWEWERTAPAFAQMDVHGYNYQWSQYVSDHEIYPERIMIGTESFPKESFDNWQMVEKYPYVIGDFVWTGWDYLGESGIGHTNLDNEPFSFSPPWPWFNAYCGDISILGYKKPQMYYRDVVWRNSELEMLVHAPIPEGRKEIVSMWGWPEEWKSWNWEGNEGKTMQVSVYTRCDQVRLELNGELVSIADIPKENPPTPQIENSNQSRKINALTAYFDVPYQTGELVAIGLKDGQEVVRQSLKSAGKPAILKISSEKIKPGEDDLAYFNVEILDENGNLVPNAVIPVDFEILGDGKLQAVGNGNPTDMKSFQQQHVNTFRGRCQLIVRLDKAGGKVSVSAKSEGLESGSATI